MNINWQNLLAAKRKYLKNLVKDPTARYTHNKAWIKSDQAQETLKLQVNIAFLDTDSQKRVLEMVEAIEKKGYMITNHPRGEKYTTQGNLLIRGTRGNMKLYGFINPLGKLTLDKKVDGGYYSRFVNCLTVNYRRVNMVVRDNYLVVALKNL